MSQENFGSYAFGTFTANEEENERLRRQASIAWQMEREVLLQAGVKKDSRVLDLACGQGVTSFQMANDIVGAGGEVHGVELNDLLLRQAQDLVKEYKGEVKLHYSKGDVYNLADIEENAYDFAYARFLFQHLDDPQKAFAAIKRCLKPGGRLIIADVDDAMFTMYPEPECLKELINNAVKYQKEHGGDRLIGRKLAQMYKEAGFKNINSNVVMINSDQIGADDFLHITTTFKALLYPADKQEEAYAIVEKLRTHMKSTPECLACNGVYITYGDK